MDAIIQRQDKGHLYQKMETFQVENAARRSLKELMSHFQHIKQESDQKTASLHKEQLLHKKQIETLQTFVKQLRTEMDRVDAVTQKMHVAEVNQLNFSAGVNKMVQQLADDIKIAKLTLESKIQNYSLVSDKVNLHEESLQRLEKVVLSTKQSILDDFAALRTQFGESCLKVDDKAHQLNRSIMDVKFWIDEYNKSFKEADGKFNNIRTELMAEIDQLKYDQQQKVGISDMHANFKELSDLLIVKFKQIEDVKEGLRDMLVYQKYFYPLQL